MTILQNRKPLKIHSCKAGIYMYHYSVSFKPRLLLYKLNFLPRIFHDHYQIADNHNIDDKNNDNTNSN